MKKTTWLLTGVLAVALLWGAAEAQAQTFQRSAERGTVLHAGAYHVLSLVGQPVAGRLTSRSGGIWQLRRQLAAQRAASAPGALDVPADYALEANYPNPFNPQTTIRFTLPEAVHVQIRVFDLLGREVARLVDADREAGRHEVAFDARDLASGMYLYRMQAGSFEQHRTMLLVK